MMTRWMLAAAAACTTLVAPAFGQQADDAKAVLNESTKAMQNFSAVTFDSKKYGTGMLKEIINCEGQVKMMRTASGKTPTVLVTGKIKQPAGPDKVVTYMNDGTVARWLDQTKNTWVERSLNDSMALQEFNLAKQLVPEDYFSNQPFAQVLRMEKLTKLPNDNVKGEVCDIIQGSTADGSRTITWAISVTDRLPRKLEMATGMGGNSIAMILEMTNVNTGAKLTMKDFEVAVPTGYVKDIKNEAMNPAVPGQIQQPQVELGLKPGTEAPAFSVKDAQGNDVSLAAMKGNVVVLEFFGTMFKASTLGSIGMQTLAEEFGGKNVKFVGMACREGSDSSASDYFKMHGLTYTLVPKGDAAVEDYNVKGFPSYYVIDANGKVAAFYQSFPGRDTMASAINQAMSAN